MLLVAFLSVALVTVPLAGGSLDRLADLRLRKPGLLGLAVSLQILVFVVIPDAPRHLVGAAHVASYLVAGVFLVDNLRHPGMWLITLGAAMNLAAIAANGGIMPASPGALAVSGMVDRAGGFTNTAALPAPNLAFLGDVFAIPDPFPFHNVFSAGDAVIALGVLVGLHRVCGSRLFPSGAGQLSSLFAYRDLRWLWGAQIVSNLGDWVYTLAVVATLGQRGGAEHILALLLIAEVAPATVAGVLGGPLVDRLPRKALMVGSDVLRGLAIASLLLGTPTVGHFYVVAVCLGLLRAVFQPALQASLPNVVPHDRIVGANALMAATFHTAVMVGPVLGGLLVAQVGPRVAFMVNAGSFVISAIFLWTIYLPHRASFALRRMALSSSPARDLVEGIRYSLHTRLVRAVFIVTGLVMLASAMKSPLEPVLILQTLDGGAGALGLAGGAWGLGMLLGSVAAPAAAGRWGRERLLGLSVGVVGVAVLLASRAGSIPALLLLWVPAGVANAIGSVAYESLLQERTPDHLRGRVIGASEAVLDGAFLAGVSMAGWLGGAFGVRGAFAVAGSVFLMTAFLSAGMLAPGRRRRYVGTHSPRREELAPTGEHPTPRTAWAPNDAWTLGEPVAPGRAAW